MCCFYLERVHRKWSNISIFYIFFKNFFDIVRQEICYVHYRRFQTKIATKICHQCQEGVKISCIKTLLPVSKTVFPKNNMWKLNRLVYFYYFYFNSYIILRCTFVKNRLLLKRMYFWKILCLGAFKQLLRAFLCKISFMHRLPFVELLNTLVPNLSLKILKTTIFTFPNFININHTGVTFAIINNSGSPCYSHFRLFFKTRYSEIYAV